MQTTKGFKIVLMAVCLFWVAVFLKPVAVHGQDAPILEKFTADEIGGKVKLSWTIAAGGTCNGIQIQRSSDSLSFIEIGSLEGVCGNLSFPTDYTFTDVSPEKNRNNVYRLDLGGNGYSGMVSVLIIDTEALGYALFPMPLVAQTELHFRNDGLRKATLHLYDQRGNLVYVVQDETEKFSINRSLFQSSGSFYFRIEIEGTDSSLSGELIVQ